MFRSFSFGYSQPEIPYLFSTGSEKAIKKEIQQYWLTADIPNKLLSHYKVGAYRNCIIHLQHLIDLHLPDGRRDTYLFLLAECHIQLRLNKLAIGHLNEVFEKYPNSKYHPMALFRLSQIYYKLQSDTLLTNTYKTMRAIFPDHHLTSASAYLFAKWKLENGNTSETLEIVRSIQKTSVYYDPSRFLAALAVDWQGDSKKALTLFKNLLNATKSKPLKEESILLVGHINAKLGKFVRAREFLRKIPKNSNRHALATLKIAMTYMSENQHNTAIEVAHPLLTHKQYNFEAALVLLTGYWELKDTVRAFAVRRYLSNYARLTHIIIQAENEKIKLDFLHNQFNTLSLHPLGHILKNLPALGSSQSIALKNKFHHLSSKLQENQGIPSHISPRTILERQLLSELEKDLNSIQKQYSTVVSRAEGATQANNPDSTLTNKVDSLFIAKNKIDLLVNELLALNKESELSSFNPSQILPKLVDVGFIMYQRLKERYYEINENIRLLNKKKETFTQTRPNERRPQ